MNEADLAQFIAYESVADNSKANEETINYLKRHLTAAGFHCHIEGQDLTEQPVLVAHRPAVRSLSKVLIYNHYDVEPAKGLWISGSPFQLKEIEGRFYGRGIADNKGPLWARLNAFKNLHLAHRPCPEILWLIQGEEEVKDRSNKSADIFKTHFQNFRPNYYVEETGYHNLEKNEQAVFLWAPLRDEDFLAHYRPKLAEVFKGQAFKFKHEHLIKFPSVNPCPFLSNLPDDAVYVGFGPNDPSHNIHGKNESLDKARLLQHIDQFESFLSVIS